MTIDPMAAVTSATGSAGSPAAADPAASTGSARPDHNAAGVQNADDGAKVDLRDYASQHQNKPPAIETLQPEGQAKYLANPAALGEKVLSRMESLHQRSLDYRNQLHAGSSPQALSAGSGEGVMSGPASQNVAGSGKTPAGDVSNFALMFDYAIETSMISSSSSQFVSGVNTLMKGQ